MTVIVIYGFTGKYAGNAEYEWNHPEVGATHKCMLFLRQDSESNEYQTAVAECGRYGFTEIENMRYGTLQIEALNTDLYRGFAGFYEGALQDGSTLLFYPNKGASGSAA